MTSWRSLQRECANKSHGRYTVLHCLWVHVWGLLLGVCSDAVQVLHASDVQRDAKKRLDDPSTTVVGAASEALRRLGAIGGCGNSLQNAERDLRCLLQRHCDLPVVRPAKLHITSGCLPQNLKTHLARL